MAQHHGTPTRTQPARDRLAGALLIVALPLLVAGLIMPSITVTKVMLFDAQYSIVGGIVAFWSQDRYLLFAVVLVFSVLFPTAKVAIGFSAWYVMGSDHPALRRLLRAFAAVSKWSMLDVFIVALTVLVMEGSLIASADVGPGIFLFAAAVLLSTFATKRLSRVVDRRAGLPDRSG